MTRHTIPALAAALLIVACVGACGGERETPGSVATIRPDSSATVSATGAPDTSLAPTATTAADASSARARSWGRFLALHEAAVAGTADTAMPRLLWEAGSLAATELAIADRASPDSAYAARLPEFFPYDEIGGSYLYSGWHLRELVRRFPTHELADDAGFLAAHLPRGGECEGFFSCYLSSAMGPLTGFLAMFPRSELAPAAVDSIDRDMRALFDELDSGSVEYTPLPDASPERPDHDTQDVEQALERYARAVSALPEPLRSDARQRLAPLLDRWRARRR